MSDKLKVGVLDITGCNGCVLSVAFNEDEVLDIFNLVDVQAYRFVSDQATEEMPEFDVVLMEGLVASPRDLELLKEVRAHTKVLVALGTCAHTGYIPAYRKWARPEGPRHLITTRQTTSRTSSRRPRTPTLRWTPRSPAARRTGARSCRSSRGWCWARRTGRTRARLRGVPPEQQHVPAGGSTSPAWAHHLRRLLRDLRQRRPRVLGLPRPDGRCEPRGLHEDARG